MKRSLILRACFLLISGFCLILLYLMASWSIESFSSQGMNTEKHSMTHQHLLSDIDSINSLMKMDTSGDGNNGPRKYAEQKIIHLDLKGMPLLPKYMAILFPFLKKMGATGLLIEYEDMFPFDEAIEPIKNKDAYTKDDIRYINELALSNNLEIIPLVQTFGHMEYVLKLDQFSELREVPKYPQVICPSNNNSISLIKTMIDQVINLHPGIKHLHIGSDEVYFLGVCQLCTTRMTRDHLNEPELFLEHVKSVVNYLRETYSPIRVLMWDDEFRKLDEDVILKSGLGQLVDIVVWNYGPEVQESLPLSLWQKYIKIFKVIWMGSAFKGADKPDTMVVNETHYLSNHYSWVKLAREQSPEIMFKGIVMTGWQRYDHFSVPCEIFPVAIPSLTSCLTYMNSSKYLEMNEVFSIAKYILKCGSRLDYCSFPGSNIHDHVKALYNYQMELKELKKSSVFRGWMSNYNLKLRFSSPSHVESMLHSFSRLNVELNHLKQQLESNLAEVFPKSSVDEWMLINFSPMAEEVKDICKSSTEILDKPTFPVRPLNNNVDLID